jgi:transcriptional regulator with XRE-family HTH domain
MVENQQLGATQASQYTPDGDELGRSGMAVTSEQIRAARGLLRWEQRDLAEAADLSIETIKAIERRPGPLMVRTSTLYAIQKAFDDAGVAFFEGDNGGAGVRWKRK